MKIAVIGLGIVGLSVCTRLAKAGHEVAGFEQFELMHANGSSHGDTRIIRLTPGEGPLYADMAQRAHEIWQFWERQAGVQLLQWSGGLMAGPPGSAFVASCVALGSEKSRALLRGDAIYYLTRGALAFPREWDVCRQDDCGVTYADPARKFLIDYARECGAKLHASAKIATPVTGTTLTIDGEPSTFDAVIVAGGGWAGKLLPEFAKRFIVRRRVVGWLKPHKEMAPPPVVCVDNDGVYQYSSFFGGALYTAGKAIAVAGGAVYLGGVTNSSDFPITPGAYANKPPGQASMASFVAKFATGTSWSVVYSTFLDLPSTYRSTYLNGLAVDAAGQAYVAGYTDSGWFPTTAGALRSVPPFFDNIDAFLTVLNSSGGALVYSTPRKSVLLR